LIVHSAFGISIQPENTAWLALIPNQTQAWENAHNFGFAAPPCGDSNAAGQAKKASRSELRERISQVD
jgi:hypothetical protein